MRNGLFNFRRIILVTSIVVALVFSGSLLCNLSSASNWEYETIAIMYSDGQMAAAVDGDGQIHVVFHGRMNSESGLFHGIYTREGFKIDLITAGVGEVWGGISMKIDDSDRIHVTWADFDIDVLPFANGIRYAVRDDGQWIVETIDSRPSRCANMVVDSQGRVQIMYLSSGLIVANQTLQGWALSEIPTEDMSPVWISHAQVDGDDRIGFIVDCEVMDERVTSYALYDGIRIETIDILSIEDSDPSLTYNEENEPVIGLIENTTGIPRYSIATFREEVWQYDPIAVCEHPTFHVAGIPYVEIRNGIMYASCVIDQGHDEVEIWCAEKMDTGWTMSLVDESSLWYTYAMPVIVDSNEVIHLLYPKYEGGELAPSLMLARDSIDFETRIQPLIVSLVWALIAGVVCVSFLFSGAYLFRRRAREIKGIRDFKKSSDSLNYWSSSGTAREKEP